jgi:hypothetical protein
MNKNKKVGRPKSKDPKDKLFRLRMTEAQKELVSSAGTADFWRKHMIEQAKENLGIEIEYKDIEKNEKEKSSH